MSSQPGGARPDVVVAGHICLDLTPRLERVPPVEPGSAVQIGELSMEPGGAVGNTTRALAEEGVAVSAVAHVGEDELGRILCTGLERAGVDPGSLRVQRGAQTGYTLVIEASSDERSFWHSPGANRSFDPARVNPAGAPLLHLGYPSLLPALADAPGSLSAWLARHKARGTTIALDLTAHRPQRPSHERAWASTVLDAAEHVDVFCASEADLAASGFVEPATPVDPERIAAQLLDRGAAVVLLKRGSQGLHLRTASRARLARAGAALAPHAAAWSDAAVAVAPPPLAGPLRTNGAGDWAVGGLLAAIVRGSDPQAAAVAATDAARRRVQSASATTDVPGEQAREGS